MTPQTLTPSAAFILVALGLLFGGLLVLVGVGAALLYHAAFKLRAQHQETTLTLRETAAASDRLRLDILAALSRFDAERLFEAGQVIVRGAQSLTTQTQALGKMLYASAATSAAGMQSLFDPLGNPTPGGAAAFTIDDEAADDARMLADRARWSAMGGSTPPPTSLTYAEELTDPAHLRPASIPDPYAGMTQAERQRELDRFWAERRAGMHTGKTAAQVLAAAADERPQASAPASLPDFDAAAAATPTAEYPGAPTLGMDALDAMAAPPKGELDE